MHISSFLPHQKNYTSSGDANKIISIVLLYLQLSFLIYILSPESKSKISFFLSELTENSIAVSIYINVIAANETWTLYNPILFCLHLDALLTTDVCADGVLRWIFLLSTRKLRQESQIWRQRSKLFISVISEHE